MESWGSKAMWAFKEVLTVYEQTRDPAMASDHLAINLGRIGGRPAERRWRRPRRLFACAGSDRKHPISPDARAAERASTEACQAYHPDCG